MLRRIFLVIILCALFALGFACGGHPAASYQPPPPITTPYQPTPQILSSASDTVINGGSFVSLTPVYIPAGNTLTLTWASDGSLQGYIFTETQFHNFKFAGIPSGYEAYNAGSSGTTISAYVRNGDTYYAVVSNSYLFSSPVKLYQATLTEQ